mgnify:CR=1 FL=1
MQAGTWKRRLAALHPGHPDEQHPQHTRTQAALALALVSEPVDAGRQLSPRPSGQCSTSSRSTPPHPTDVNSHMARVK